MKKAFTLIELLVVIAIIAILAAILFPVFAQAKEAAKKTSSISQMKQVGTAFTIYETDSDDLFPMGYTTQTEGLIRAWPVAAGGVYPSATEVDPGFNYDTFWGNSVYPYTKSYALNAFAGVTSADAGVVQGPGAPKPEDIGVTYNGLLSTMSSSSVGNPSVVPILWPGLGKQNLKGYGWVNPMLDCGTPGRTPASLRAGETCQFNPGGPANAYTSDPLYPGVQIGFTDATGNMASAWIYGQGTLIVRTDTSAKFQKIGSAANVANNNPFGDPWAVYSDNAGTPTGDSYYCTATDGAASATNPNYPCFFRPDRTQ